tara:strand:- start:4819 stop:4968 length:150 start_codon:yes stop_codon:yes gene_type:complete
MKKEEIQFLKDRIKELEKFQHQGVTKIRFSNGKSFSVGLAIVTFKNALI